MDKAITILAIETSCDETSAAVLRNGALLSKRVYSQIDIHTASVASCRKWRRAIIF